MILILKIHILKLPVTSFHTDFKRLIYSRKRKCIYVKFSGLLRQNIMLTCISEINTSHNEVATHYVATYWTAVELGQAL